MKIVFLIGNGFDLNLGLNTRYSDFYTFYRERRSNDKRPYVQSFLKEIKDNEDWSDFELSFGKYAENFSQKSYEDYLGLWLDIHRELALYIGLQQKSFQQENIRVSPRVNKYLIAPDSFLERGNQVQFKNLRDRAKPGIDIDVINFNYTKTFEKLYDWDGNYKVLHYNNTQAYLNSITHIHGITRKNMILGVDNESQIICTDKINNLPKIRNRLIKPIANRNAQTLRDQDCAKRISEADIICIFGMSLGLTDQTWWKLIVERLQKKSRHDGNHFCKKQ